MNFQKFLNCILFLIMNTFIKIENVEQYEKVNWVIQLKECFSAFFRVNKYNSVWELIESYHSENSMLGLFLNSLPENMFVLIL